MTPSEAVGENMLEFFRHFARSHQGGEVADLDGISIASSGMAFYMFNAAFLSTPVLDAGGDLERRIDQAAGHLGRDRRHWAFWVAEDKLERSLIRKAKSAFHRRNLRFAYRHPGMINECLAPPSRPLPPLEIRRAADR